MMMKNVNKRVDLIGVELLIIIYVVILFLPLKGIYFIIKRSKIFCFYFFFVLFLYTYCVLYIVYIVHILYYHVVFVFVPVILWNLLYVQERKRYAERETVSLFHHRSSIPTRFTRNNTTVK